MLWIALHLPHLPLQALRRSLPAREDAAASHALSALREPGPPASAEALSMTMATPPALAVEQDRRVITINRAAAACGVHVGQSTATALSLAPSLRVLLREADREAIFVRDLALALGVFTPRLCVQASGVLLEVQASLRLFGGLRRLLRRVDAVVRLCCGAPPRRAMARTAGAAWLLATSGPGLRARPQARTGGDATRPSEPASLGLASSCGHDARRLDALPVEALHALSPLTPRQLEGLHLLGLHRLHELRALPRAGLQRRFGRELLHSLDRAYGDAPDPREWLAVPERFAARCELMHRADDAGSLTHAVQALLPALGGWLHLRWEAASTLALRLRHEHRRVPQADTRLVLRLAAPSRDLAQLTLLWRERLARHALAAPVYELVLELDASVPDGGMPGELLPMAGSDVGRHAALLDRLAARLGPEHVLRCEALADHRPERAQRVVSVIAPQAMPAKSAIPARPESPPLSSKVQAQAQAPAQAHVQTQANTATTLRPAWLLDTPQRLACDAHGRPLHGGPLRLCSRAERIEAGWFDGALVCRDYQVAEGADHRLRWIYRERAPDGVARWFLHGWFG